MEEITDLTETDGEAKEPDLSLLSPPLDLLVLELIPPMPCSVCGEALRYATVEQTDGHSHRVVALVPYAGRTQEPRPSVPDPGPDGRVRSRHFEIPLAETDIPNGTNIRIFARQGQHDAVVVVKRTPAAIGPGDA